MSVGGVSIDPLTGSPQIFHPIAFDGSGGASESALTGLVFDNESAFSNPFINVTIKSNNSLSTPTSVSAIVEWYDHIEGSSYSKTTNIDLTGSGAEPEYLLGFRVRDLYGNSFGPRATGVYGYTIKIVMQFDDLFEPTKLEYIYHGETAVVVQNTLRPNDMSGSERLLRTASFGDGWDLAGVPQLVNDEHGRPFEGNQLVFTPDYQFYGGYDRFMVVFPGEAPKVFTPETEVLIFLSSLEHGRRTLPSSAC